MVEDPFLTDISRRIWTDKYRLTRADGTAESSIEGTWRRIAQTLAAVEAENQVLWEQRFFEALTDFKFLPGGRIQAGAGSGREVTLFNCFVMGVIEDSLDGIFQALKEGAITMQQGGGVGYDFSTLRPAGAPARRTGTIASGPVSFMRIWDSMCATMISSGNRRGAMMATLRCDHPDIEIFVGAKRDPRELRNFNLSVLVTDAFMEAVRADADWPLMFPVEGLDDRQEAQIVERRWSGSEAPVPCRIFRRIRARTLWEVITRSAYDYAEPGVLFIDRINRENNLRYREHISSTNPCGEIPLPPYGACDLGAINLTGFVHQPFTEQARFDLDGIEKLVRVAVRMLDNVIDVSGYPLPQQAAMARGARRIGLGITGLADALIMLGLQYGEVQGRAMAADALRTICHGAYRSSVELAREKGWFPFFERDPYLASPFIKRLPTDLQSAIRAHGIRNSHLVSIAPTGTISLLAENVSSGIEPVFSLSQQRTIRSDEQGALIFNLEDYAYRLWTEREGEAGPLPAVFVAARSLPPTAHLEMQAALQPYVDNAISKTINVPEDLPFGELRSLFQTAYEKGLKGCTTFRPNPVTGAVLTAQDSAQSTHCCTPDREGE
ncbi:MAG: adenosylcobalamin-dependent ribonucleoside-diphosphate reductase [Pseudomonadota bacterium]|nr:adenosylcobalamin-dependent ribonucleoside-diphosphate reductase [Pseudomonadota bacterium]